MTEDVIDFGKVRRVKEFLDTANNRILELEAVLYDILEMNSITDIKEQAAAVLGEDLNIYLEEDTLEELDFDKDTVDFDEMGITPWQD
jgi:hypothetical protein